MNVKRKKEKNYGKISSFWSMIRRFRKISM
jgi:hypothetical protein